MTYGFGFPGTIYKINCAPPPAVLGLSLPSQQYGKLFAHTCCQVCLCPRYVVSEEIVFF